MTKTKGKPKSKQLSPPVVKATENIDASSESSSQTEQQFEVELYWCIQQLQTALSSGKLNSKQIQDHTKALNVLMSKTAPLVRKRQIMRLSFGDYRSKMAAEEKKLNKVNMQVKLSPAKPSSKSIFVKKAVWASSDNNFKFNFEVAKPAENAMQDDIEEKMEEEAKHCDNFSFLPSDNSFKFNFNVVE